MRCTFGKLVISTSAILCDTSCMSQPPEPTRTTAAYGAWSSPLTAARVTAGALRLGDVALDGDDVYWLEGRASEGGRSVIVRRAPDGRTLDVTPAGFNVRSRVHEYGGGAFTVHRGDIYFVNFADQRVYRHHGGAGAPQPITPAGWYYAKLRLDLRRRRLLAVREDHRLGDVEPAASIVAIPVDGDGDDAGRVLVTGADFYSDPALSPDGTTLAWLQWHHPNMPWDGTELWTASLGPDGLSGHVHVAGGAKESIFQPEWSPDGVLHFVSDRTGWWNLYRLPSPQPGHSAPTSGSLLVEPLHPMSAEFGKPQWTSSMVTYAFAGPRRIAATYVDQGRWQLAFIETDPIRWEPVELDLDVLEGLRADERALYFVGGSPTAASALVRVTLAAMEPETLRRSVAEAIEPGWISTPQPMTFKAGRDGRDVHAFHYPPHNPDFDAPTGTTPPLLVLTHGGPTGATDAVLDPEIQFWTSRGFAVLDVNYSGSTGYGRAYRERLNGQWGVIDVEDAVAGAQAVVSSGQSDPERLAIRGGSAGGYTTLAALTFHETFSAGASYYGISDVEVLARDTHKFESRYLDTLIGPYPAAKDLYIARSPIHFTNRLSSALILFQGLEDKVVPPSQSETMAAAVRAKGLPVAYVAYEGEQHGFRRAENIVRSLEAELYFYGRVFGFTPADRIDPVPIDNLR